MSEQHIIYGLMKKNPCAATEPDFAEYPSDFGLYSALNMLAVTAIAVGLLTLTLCVRWLLGRN